MDQPAKDQPARERWEEAYLLAAKEVDGNKMPERVAAARQTIRTRLADLCHDSDHHQERRRLASAIERLMALEAEAADW